jgi:RHS repeat-associated protein
MADGNTLVATPQDATTAVTGIGIAESSVDLANGVSSGDWVEAGLGAVGVGLEVLSMVIDPVGTVASYGVGWLIEHVQPLKEALDWFAGDPPVIRSFSETWANVAAEVGSVVQDYSSEAQTGTAGWRGAAADAYRGKAAEAADAVAGAGALADGISAGVMIMGEVVAAVREMVRDLVAEVVGRLIDWALEEIASLGIATPVVVAQASAAVAETVSKISNLVRKLVKTIGNVGPRIRKIIDKLDEIIAKLAKLARRGHAPDAPHHAPDAPHHAPDTPHHAPDTTSPSSTTPDTTSPTSTSPSSTGPSSATTADTPRTPDTASPDGASPHTSTSPDGTGSADGVGNSKQHDHDIGSTVDDPKTASQSADRPFCKDDPIDVATGEVVLSQTDVNLPGLLPLMFSRHHQSDYRAGGLFGPSWASTLDQRIEVGPTHVWLATDDGRLLRYPKPEGTEPVLPDFGPRLSLRRSGSGYTVTPTQGGLTWEFRPVGAEWEARSTLPLAAIRRRAGGEILVDYDEAGLPTRIRHSGGYEVIVDTAGGRVTALRLTSAARPVTLMRYSYDSTGQLSEVTNSSGAPLRFTHDEGGKLTSWTDRNGVWYRYVYDSEGRATSTIGSGGMLNGTLTYEHRRTVHTDTLGNATSYEFNELGQVVRQTDPLGAVTVREWDRYDRVLTVTNPLGHTTRYAYDEQGNVATITRPDGTTINATYIENGLDTVVTDPAGRSWVREYDDQGNLVTETDPAGAVTRFGYDERGHIRATTDPLGGVTRYETNDAGLITSVTDPLGATTRHQRDSFGRVVATTDALGGITRYGWTVEGRLLSRTRPDGSTELWRYDGEGNQIEHVDALGQVTRTQFTYFDLPAARTTPDGARTSYVYDTELRLVEVVGPHGLKWRYDYDAAGNMLRETDFDGRVLIYTYDAAGRLSTRTNGMGETVNYERDVHGDVVAKHTPAGTSTFDRDPCGRLVRAANPYTEVVFDRDARGRVLAETVAGRTVRFGFDAVGRRVSRQTSVGLTSTWDYDPAGNPVALHANGTSVTFQHDLLGRQVQRSLGELTVTQSWSTAHRLTSQVVAAKRPITHRGWRYRPDGYLDGISDPAGARRLTLDRRGRVVAVQGQGWSERYDYDLVGNITYAALPSADDGAAGPREYAATRLRSAGRTSYVHDRQGRVVQRRHRTLSGRMRLWRYTWDAEDRLTSVITPDGSIWRYHYDPMGRRIAKQRLDAAGNVLEHTHFTWDGARLAEHVHSSGTTSTWEYQPGSATPVAQIDQDEIDQRFYAIVADIVGSPTELVDANGEVSWRRAATLWGRTLSQSGRAVCPLRFPGQYHDPETGWHYNYFRYYDPETGRYASPDPLGLAPSVNPGAYVPNPTRQIDPLGLQSCGVSGDEAKQQALADADVPPGSEPLETRLVPATNNRGKQIMDENWEPVYFPEEVYLNNRGEAIVFQDHYTGHQFGEGGVGDQPPHAHVRPSDNTRNGQVPGAQEHYYYDPSLGRPTIVWPTA